MPGQAQLIIEDMENDFEDKVAGSMIGAMRALFRATPKDTTYASRSWQITRGQPIVELTQGTVASRTARQNRSENVARSFLFDSTFELVLSNDAPYIQRLDQGHSRQAPAGFVNRAVIQGLRQRIL